ncbi:MAG: DEAD/DEAH box helicase family protein [Methylococcales bacterium]|nr:DEAD/DEAH box helicase family protein [Methylococcales bacterium]MBT7410556.1 DEAD/DEAH box helicase family protein [Methylococcales bacterium]
MKQTSPLMLLNENSSLWDNYFSQKALIEGKKYFDDGRILEIEIFSPDDQVETLAEGNEANIYQTSIFFTTRKDDEISNIIGKCSCPTGFNCKHIVASIHTAIMIKQQNIDSVQSEKTIQPTVTNALDPNINIWLKQFNQKIEPKQNNYPEHTNQRILYILLTNYKNEVEVKLLSVDAINDNYCNPVNFFIDDIYQIHATSYILPEDIEIMEAILSIPNIKNTSRDNSFILGHRNGPELIIKMLQTERCFWQTFQDEALSLGEELQGNAQWDANYLGIQSISFNINEISNYLIWSLQPLWYIDLDTLECGPINLGVSDETAYLLKQAPEIPPEQINIFHQHISQVAPEKNIPLPQQLHKESTITVSPKPVLKLWVADLPKVLLKGWSNPNTKEPMAVATLAFKYNDLEINFFDHQAELLSFKDNQIFRIPRQRDQEIQFFDQLASYGMSPLSTLYKQISLPSDYQTSLSWIDQAGERAADNFTVFAIPKLKTHGWQIEISEDWPFTIADDIQEWYADIDDSSGIDWFSLEVGITLQGKKLNLLPLLIKYIKQFPGELNLQSLRDMSDDAVLLPRLEDGRLIPLPIERIRGILETLIELFDDIGLTKEEKLKLPVTQAIKLAELEAASGNDKLRWLGGEKLRSIGQKLRNFESISPVQLPHEFNAELRTYQQKGLEWLQFLREYNFGGILADDMGLGKTVQTLAHIFVEKTQKRLTKPALVIAPTSLMANWRMESKQFTPDLKVLTIHGPARKDLFEQIPEHDLVLTTYPLLSRDQDDLLKHHFHLLILDEAHIIKNPKARATQIVHQIQANHRLCLTGTPMENHLGELWSLFHFLSPGLLGDLKQFKKIYRTPIEKQNDMSRKQSLTKRISPFILRRKKEEVVKDLPPKTEIIRNIDMESTQRDLYESIRLSMHQKVQKEVSNKGIARSQIIILDALLKLRQVCCDPRLLNLKSSQHVKQSAKLEMLLEFLPEMIEEGRRILLFSQFTSMLGLIEANLRKLNIGYVKLTGQTKDRQEPIEKFQNGEVPLFLISLKAGGTGLNLTAADTVIHYDPWWNPAVEQQATDRAYRIGQDKPVFVYKLITSGSVEEKMLELQDRKRTLSEGILSGKDTSNSQITSDDLNILFEPLG